MENVIFSTMSTTEFDQYILIKNCEQLFQIQYDLLLLDKSCINLLA